MNATYKVKNRENKTAGFIVDGNYVKYYNAFVNIDLIDNLSVAEDGTIESKSGTLKEITVKQIHEKIYSDKCSENPLERDVQADLERWKDKWSNYVLYLTGARQIGKTTELLKYAYKNYEQIIYINLAEEDSLKDFEELVLSNSLHFGMINYCRKSFEEY